MILRGELRPGNQPGYPWLVWLHGFLGSRAEWAPLSPAFSDWPQLLLDLPGHGESVAERVADFPDMEAALQATLDHYQIGDYWLVGYSLGGRIAMYHACYGHTEGLRGMVVEGGNPGLALLAERRQRRAHDDNWARRLRQEPFTRVLADWYHQPVFASLSEPQRQALVELRKDNDPRALADMLVATSLGRQPDLLARLQEMTLPFYYLCGEQDAKFRAIAGTLPATTLTISAAGHNAHRENPAGFVHSLYTLLCQPNSRTPHALP
ncbi:2-succinyl-6-hydroxy-2,4-cyclohexadiene-1-carboxylate synthase [Shimwellia blattae]|uniref:2-succinyl-6-hydroxy-2,4-cyclohexadiene-1-carboxylate synthase n=1 Tax=Shimwellia blattae (strain ATCC 29907 / DSM 4481 / JCM 1650 / NBRC 105725 / CDC 9005-74) TaxID=630626 RepID=I2B785_SHIBC|nr:2-succinyl-6-hydroxy-2,4-cyclohexadiene-1-carboxylate synthase [Shimwellia blattae]AFJ46389.1 hydrolase [Shimwellia blattae DSM 4481 = NBRC 105725]GAB79972.1 2-succinyl-6-hydroxy-2,4-cyclohexadiene-1-carboxylate synthase [Shimwellia blattae DSM 4481 = NBRC 105725]VDY63856.1 2-succinyl-6-hydroxy-2,4-cyclohexadiene-1-carboxylate synthase [Shimwellia blattae]VEC21994.1 2-succinyl-6-hydroxy-2,4-cyclohexadiene-1-carboxylate synthase [Shimwellia blattae]